jgi:hypothetical protein
MEIIPLEDSKNLISIILDESFYSELEFGGAFLPKNLMSSSLAVLFLCYSQNAWALYKF